MQHSLAIGAPVHHALTEALARGLAHSGTLASGPQAAGPAWLDPQRLLDGVGIWGLALVALILFAECGLLVGFFLPGDSLLFTAGLLVAGNAFRVPLLALLVVAAVAAIAGNLVGYWIGRQAGPAVFNRADSRMFRREYVDKTAAFFDRYGSRAIVLARFVPIVRTFITVMAGVGRMDPRRYFTYSTIGGALWTVGVSLLGYYLGQVAFVRSNLEIILVGIVVLSVVPIGVEVLRSRRARAAEQR